MKAARRHADPAMQFEYERIYAELTTISTHIQAILAAIEVVVSETEPSSPPDGLRWFQASTGTLKEWINGAWRQLYPAQWS